MPQLYNSETEAEIRQRFLKKCDDLITAGRAQSYAEICKNIDIAPASFNGVKNDGRSPSKKMLYNLQAVYKISVESILFVQPPRLNLVFIKTQMHVIHNHMQEVQQSLEQIEKELAV